MNHAAAGGAELPATAPSAARDTSTKRYLWVHLGALWITLGIKFWIVASTSKKNDNPTLPPSAIKKFIA